MCSNRGSGQVSVIEAVSGAAPGLTRVLDLEAHVHGAVGLDHELSAAEARIVATLATGAIIRRPVVARMFIVRSPS